VGIRCSIHVTPLYPQKLALSSPAGGGRAVGIVRSRTKATEIFTDAAKERTCMSQNSCWMAFLENMTYRQPRNGFGVVKN
jgi:hypothetical protein